MRNIWFGCLFFVSQLLCSNTHLAPESALIEEGFVTFATSNYFGLLEVLIASVHTFSTRPIIAYGVNADIPFSTEKYPRLIKRRLLDLQGDIFAQKSRIILESKLQYGVYVEADDIVNQGVDTLFSWCRNSHAFPLSPIHPDDPDNQQMMMEHLGVKEKSMHYIHAHVLFSQECMPFVKEWYDLCVQFDPVAGNADETILNVLLWKNNVTDSVPIYDPFYEHYREYLQGIDLKYETVDGPFYCYMFHGCKNASEAWRILHKLKVQYISNSAMDLEFEGLRMVQIHKI